MVTRQGALWANTLGSLGKKSHDFVGKQLKDVTV